MRRSILVVSIALLGIGLLGVTPAAAQTPINCGMTITTSGDFFLPSDLSCPGTAIQVAADDVEIDLNGHTLTGSGSGTGIITSDGTTCVAVTGLDIEDGTITGFELGIHLCAPASTDMDADVEGMTLTGNEIGIQLTNSDGNEIEKNDISDNGATGALSFGVFLVNSQDNKFERNQVNRNASTNFFCGGFLLANSSGNEIEKNDISDNGSINGGLGVFVSPTSNGNKFENNLVNDTPAGPGVVVLGSNNQIEGNTAVGNGGAFDLIDGNPNCDNNTWEDNTFGSSNQPCIQ